ncbi:MAG: DUF4139 domain-containing protein [Candidatus Zixiibacteriota bacterium]
MKNAFVILLLMGLVPIAMADDIYVTVYNSNLGVVSETRKLSLEKGTHLLAFRDVPAQIDPNSVQFSVVGSAPGQVSILEQNFAFDLVNEGQMFSRYIDKAIELIDQDGRVYNGTLLAHSSKAVTLQEQSGRIKVVLLENIAELDFPSLPEGLITRPTLFWLYDSDRSGERDCQVAYQTSGMSWAAEYVGVLSESEAELSISGWAAINNRSGKKYADAKLKLIAGDIHRATAPRIDRFMTKSMATPQAASAGFEEKSFFEYHLYTLPRNTTLADKEIKQISLFEPAQASVEKIFRYKPEHNPTAIEVAIKFTNSKKAGLGLPLPAGRVRIFKADSDGSLVLLGEDRLKHTPTDEEVSLKIGSAFDLVGEHRLAAQRRISKQVEERDFEIELRNRKTEAVTIEVEKKLYGHWEITASTAPYTKKDASTILFSILIAAGETESISFTARFGAN